MTINTNNRKSYRIAKEIKDQILKRIKEEGVSVSQAAKITESRKRPFTSG